jgi:glycosyltransferase involved in cell wall biosynthesis
VDGARATQLRGLAIEVREYGRTWGRRTEIEQVPLLAPHARLLDLLDHHYREDVLRLTLQILDIRPSVLHVWQDHIAAVLAGVLAGVPRIVLSRSSLSADHWKPQLSEQSWELHKRPLRDVLTRLVRTDRILLTNNSRSGRQSDEAWSGLEPGSARPLRNVIDLESLVPVCERMRDLRLRLGLQRGEHVVGGVFRLNAVKRPLLWLETAAALAARRGDTRFLLVGDGPERVAVAARAEALGISSRLVMVGHVDDVASCYALIDVLLMTSEREGVPNVIVEAQHLGVPVVATNVGGIGDVVQSGRTGFLVDGADPERLAERIDWVLEHQAWRTAAGLRARRCTERYALDRVVGWLLRHGYGLWARRGRDRPPRPRRPGGRSLRLTRARELAADGRRKDAISLLERHVADSPEHLESRLALVKLLTKQRRFGDALAHLAEARDRHPRAVEPGFLTGRVFWTSGDHENALSWLCSTLERAPQHDGSRLLLHRLLVSLGRLEEARALYLQSETVLGPAVALARMAALGDGPGAARAQLERVRRQPPSRGVDAACGRLWLDIGRLREARRHFVAAPATRHTDEAIEQIDDVLQLLGEPLEGTREALYPDMLLARLVRDAPCEPQYVPVRRRVCIAASQLGAGGSERQCVVVAEAMATRPEIESLSFVIGSLDGSRGFFGGRLRRIPASRIELLAEGSRSAPVCLPEPLQRFGALIAALPTDLRTKMMQLSNAILACRPEVLHVSQDYLAAAIAGCLLGVPRLVVRRGTIAPDRPEVTLSGHARERIFRPMRSAYRALLERGGLVLLNNSPAGCLSDQLWLGAPNEVSAYVPNAVDPTVLATDPARVEAVREEWRIEPGERVVAGVFALRPEKRLLLWLEVAAGVARRRQDVRFVLLGDGQERARVKARAAELGLGARLVMPGTVDDMQNRYPLIDVLLHTAAWEGTPNALLEAQAFGVPIVAVDAGAVGRIVAHGETGFVLDDPDVDGMAERVAWILDADEWR